MKLPRLATGVNRFASGGNYVTAGVKPAFKFSCSCRGPATNTPASCTCEWSFGSCWGNYTSYADGSWERHRGCNAKA
jgi:hypothetical protein